MATFDTFTLDDVFSQQPDPVVLAPVAVPAASEPEAPLATPVAAAEEPVVETTAAASSERPPEPEPPSLQELSYKFECMRNNTRLVDNLGYLQNLANDVSPVTMGDLYSASLNGENYLQIGEQALPWDEQFREQKIDTELLAAPLKRFRTARKRLAMALAGMERAAADIDKRVARQAKTILRQHGGATRKQRELEMTLKARELQPFDGMHCKNRVIFGATSQIILEFQAAPVEVDLADLPEGWSNANHLLPYVMEQHLEYVDHTAQIRIASYVNKVKRHSSYLLEGCYSDGTAVFHRIAVNALNSLDDSKSLPVTVNSTTLNPGKLSIYPTIRYTLTCKRSDIPDVISTLSLLQDQPIFRHAGLTVVDDGSEDDELPF
jgi:hypothetical protein